MENLIRESDGFCRTLSGFCAVVPKIASGTRDSTNWFEFKTSPLSDITRVEWPKDAPLALFDNETAQSMLRAGYAKHPTDAMVADYNEAVDAYNVANPKQEAPAGGQQGSSGSGGTDDTGKGTEPQQTNPQSGTEGTDTFPPEGWAVHPTAPGYYYMGQEVITEAELRAKVVKAVN